MQIKMCSRIKENRRVTEFMYAYILKCICHINTLLHCSHSGSWKNIYNKLKKDSKKEKYIKIKRNKKKNI